MGERHSVYPAWVLQRCSRCGGSGAEYAFDGLDECRDCGGGGGVWLHEKSGTLACYPGGPLIGCMAGSRQETNR